MIATHAVLTCDGRSAGDRCRRTWPLPHGMRAAHALDAAREHGWTIEAAGDWCPIHAAQKHPPRTPQATR